VYEPLGPYVGLPKPKLRTDYEKYSEAWWLIADFLGIPTEAQAIEAQTVIFGSILFSRIEIKSLSWVIK
jgi:hypothetical protein